MQVVVSTSLQTSNSRFNPAPGTVPAWPEIRISSVEAWLIVVSFRLCSDDSLHPLDFHQEALGFRRVGIGIGDCGRQQVRRSPSISSFILVNTAESLVNRQPDLINLLAVDHHRLETASDKGFRDVSSA